MARGSSVTARCWATARAWSDLEGARGAREKQDGEHGLAAEPALRGADGKQERRQRLADLTDAGNDTAVEQVEHLPGDDRHRDQWKELHQPDQTEVERIVGELVDLPADRHALRQEGAVGEGPRTRTARRSGGRSGAWARRRARTWLGSRQYIDWAEAAAGSPAASTTSRLSRITIFSAKRASPSLKTIRSW